MAIRYILSAILVLYGTEALHSPDFYTAAVYEYSRRTNHDDIAGSIQHNLNSYENAAREAALKGADIIVFPEMGLVPTEDRNKMNLYFEDIPKPSKFNPIFPCQHASNVTNKSILYRLSCITRAAGIYVVANLGESVPCSPQNDTDCRADYRKLFYNTNVVFEPSGIMIARHRKAYLFNEFSKNSPKEPDFTVFNTTFGTFGVVICFESVYKFTVDLIEKFHIDNLIISTSWVEHLPYGSSVQYFQSLALGNKVNLLAAGIHNPTSAAIGSAIISGTEGALTYTYEPQLRTSKLLVARVPRKTSVSGNATIDIVPRNISGVWYFYANFSDYTMKVLEKSSDLVEACHNGLCCRLNYTGKSTSKTHNAYLAVFNGTFGIMNYYFFSQEICIVVVCEKYSNCTHFPTESDIRFDGLHLSGNIRTPYQYPNVLASGMNLVPYRNWRFSSGYIGFESGKVESPLLSVSILGRAYDRDPPYPHH